MNQYEIRRAEPADLERILEIYAIAREFMVRNGNPTQWSGGYPAADMLAEDMDRNNLYVLQKRVVSMVFSSLRSWMIRLIM